MIADPIVSALVATIISRSEMGIAKYGATLARTDLERADWLRLLQEELLDASLYVQRLIEELEQER